MRYMILLYGDPTIDIDKSQEEIKAEYTAYMAFGEEARKRGVNPDVGDALQPANTATTVRVRDGKTMVTDGPYAETKEILGGFYILDCKDLDQAIELAALIPAAKNGTVEIRPIVTDYSV